MTFSGGQNEKYMKYPIKCFLNEKLFHILHIIIILFLFIFPILIKVFLEEFPLQGTFKLLISTLDAY